MRGRSVVSGEQIGGGGGVVVVKMGYTSTAIGLDL